MPLHCTVNKQLLSLQPMSNCINLPKQSFAACLHSLSARHLPRLAALTPFIRAAGGREVLYACCAIAPSKARLQQSYCGAASTPALFPAPLLQSRQVRTGAGTQLLLTCTSNSLRAGLKSFHTSAAA